MACCNLKGKKSKIQIFISLFFTLLILMITSILLLILYPFKLIKHFDNLRKVVLSVFNDFLIGLKNLILNDIFLNFESRSKLSSALFKRSPRIAGIFYKYSNVFIIFVMIIMGILMVRVWA